MTAATSEIKFVEADFGVPTESVPLAHLSLELGHLYMEDYSDDGRGLSDHFDKVRPWVETARKLAEAEYGAGTRISTCFLIDDYFSPLGDPTKIVHQVLEAAQANGLTIDYVARESACARIGDFDVAQSVLNRLVSEPSRATNGSRPPVEQTGWLANGRRTPNFEAAPAMAPTRWSPPEQAAANRHSVFVDVEVWDQKQWSCAYLAAVWQLARLGLLRKGPRSPFQPTTLKGPLPDSWLDLPAVLKTSSSNMPFNAYRTMSVLPARFLEIETATRVVLSQYRMLPTVELQMIQRSRADRVDLPPDLCDRAGYVFISG